MTSVVLYPHQKRSAEFLAARAFAGDFSGMGSGKTISSLAAVKKTSASRVLIIGPPISLPMWARWTQTMLSQPARILKTGKSTVEGPERILVCSYEIAVKLAPVLRDWLGRDASVLICDEAHALKTPTAKRTKAVLGKGGICEGADWAWMLTGTPVTRHNDDLIPFLFRAAPSVVKERLGGLSMERFRLRYCIVQERKFAHMRYPQKIVVGSRNTEELKAILYPALAIRHELADVWADMPPMSFNRYTVGLDRAAMGAEALARLKAAEKQTASQIEKGLSGSEPALATLRRELGVGKVKAAAAEIMARVDAGQNVLVGAWHSDVIDGLRLALTKAPSVAVIDGRTSSGVRDDVEADWNEGKISVLIGQISAMGVSLNLQQGGAQIVVVEEDWSPAVMAQFYARLMRMGQKNHVHVDTLQSDTKLDEAVYKLSQRKASNMAKLT